MASSAQSTAVTLSQLQNLEGLAFRDSFSSSHMSEVMSRHAGDFRDRAYAPDVTLMAFCTQLISSDSSCREVVTKLNRDRTKSGLMPISSSTSAYCQARSRLSLGLIKDLAIESGEFMEKAVPSEWLWKGRHLKLIDGSTLSMPDTPENQQRWPQHDQQDEGIGFPIMRIVGVLSMATAACLGLAYGPYQGKETGEHALARQLLPLIHQKDILLADRYYCSYFLIAQVLAQGADLITRLHGARNYDFRRGHRLGEGDHIVELVKPPIPKWMDQETYDSIPETLELREMKSDHKDEHGDEVIIVTTLLNPETYPRSEVLGAYRLRWNVELDLRSLKTVMGMDILSCKSPEMIEKEVWTYILAYNLIRQLICQAPEKHKVEPRRISFTGAIQTFNAFLPLINVGPPEFSKRMYDAMIDIIAQHKIPNRPGRSEPKAVKRRPKAYPRLTKPRSQFKKQSIS
jgi:hypothetical protein